MSNFYFGVTMLVVGMGGTMLTLYLLTLLIKGLTKILPPQEEGPKHGE